MTDLVSRLLEAIAAKEAKARVVGEERLRWEFGEFSESVTVENANDYVACGPYGGGIDADDGRFIADNDPSSVLRRCAADRDLIADIQADRHRGDPWICESELNPGSPCDCGRDERVARRLSLLTAGYGLEVTE